MMLHSGHILALIWVLYEDPIFCIQKVCIHFFQFHPSFLINIVIIIIITIIITIIIIIIIIVIIIIIIINKLFDRLSC